jgi:hypothetical protein
MAQNDKQQSASKRQNTLHQRRSARTSQDQYGGQEGTNPSGNQDQFNIDELRVNMGVVEISPVLSIVRNYIIKLPRVGQVRFVAASRSEQRANTTFSTTA